MEEGDTRGTGGLGHFGNMEVVGNSAFESACGARDLGWEDPLQKEVATHSSILAWIIPWTGNLVGYSPWDHKESDTTEWPGTKCWSVSGRGGCCWKDYLTNRWWLHIW